MMISGANPFLMIPQVGTLGSNHPQTQHRSFPPQAMFPNGLPSVDPNQPLQSQRRLQEALGSAKGPENGEEFGLKTGGYSNEW
jgi:hypothetical protein